MRKAVLKFFPVFLAVVLLWGCAAREPLMHPAPALVPGTGAAMNTPGYWISRHPDPDRLIMSAEKIAALNQHVVAELETVDDIGAFEDQISGDQVRRWLDGALAAVIARGYFTAKGQRARRSYFDECRDNLDLSSIPENVSLRFGFVTAHADQRILPLESGLYKKDINLSFDRLQNSALDVGTPLAVCHESRDGLWVYVRSPLSRGWVRADKVALCSKARLQQYLAQEDFAVVTAAKADIFGERELLTHGGRCRMGARFSLLRLDDGVAEVLMPVRNADGSCSFLPAFLRGCDVSRGFLPYTPRNIINQAFALLNTPYGWGGMFGEQDCSRFVQEVFATCGIRLPRNSGLQSAVGMKIGFDGKDSRDERIRVLAQEAVPGVTTLRTNGHIMLYLGMDGGLPYAIHDLWGYAASNGDESHFMVVNRTAVTGLLLGEGTKGGSLLEKVVSVRIVANE